MSPQELSLQETKGTEINIKDLSAIIRQSLKGCKEGVTNTLKAGYEQVEDLLANHKKQIAETVFIGSMAAVNFGMGNKPVNHEPADLGLKDKQHTADTVKADPNVVTPPPNAAFTSTATETDYDN